MSEHYYPVVRAKKGEFDAFKNLPKSVLNRCTPILEIPKMSPDDYARASKKSNTPYESWLDNRADKIASIFKGHTIFLDASQWPTNFTTEGGSQILGFMHSRLSSLGVTVFPVIGYDRWESVQYRQGIKNITLATMEHFCIRLDDIALEDMADTEHFEGVLDDISATIGMSNAETPIIVDIGDVTKFSISKITEIMEDAYLTLCSFDFHKIIVTASSIPDSIEKAVKDRDSSDVVDRKEILAWKGYISANPQASLSFGDYGVRNPRSSDVIAPDMNVKIRYTIENGFFIVRGHSVRGAEGYAQSQTLCKVLVASKHYINTVPPFSWGDTRILDCSNMVFVGNSTDWIAIDTNHHIKAVTTELFEFAREIAASSARTVRI